MAGKKASRTTNDGTDARASVSAVPGPMPSAMADGEAAAMRTFDPVLLAVTKGGSASGSSGT